MIPYLIVAAAVFVVVFAVVWVFIERRAAHQMHTDSRCRETALINRLAAAMQNAEDLEEQLEDVRSRAHDRGQTI